MRMEIEVPVGGIIVVDGWEKVCVEDYTDEDGVLVGCDACTLDDTCECEHLACGAAWRSDGKSVHFRNNTK